MTAGFGFDTELTVTAVRAHDVNPALICVCASGRGLYFPIEFELSRTLRISVGDKLKLSISGSVDRGVL